MTAKQSRCFKCNTDFEFGIYQKNYTDWDEVSECCSACNKAICSECSWSFWDSSDCMVKTCLNCFQFIENSIKDPESFIREYTRAGKLNLFSSFYCSICNTTFKAIDALINKHHCYSCAKIVCKSCVSSDSKNSIFSRTCKICSASQEKLVQFIQSRDYRCKQCSVQLYKGEDLEEMTVASSMKDDGINIESGHNCEVCNVLYCACCIPISRFEGVQMRLCPPCKIEGPPKKS